MTVSQGPSLESMLALFPNPAYVPAVQMVSADAVPQPYHQLLVHTHHMTVTVEAYYGQPVNVRVLMARLEGSIYCRKILLSLRDSGQVVQFGIVRIDLDCCSAAVREAIIAGQTPLGRILIENDVLRRIEPTSFLKVRIGRSMADWFSVPEGAESYGRIGVIYCDGRPAIEVLEILAPLPASTE